MSWLLSCNFVIMGIGGDVVSLYDNFSDKSKMILEQAYTEVKSMNMNYVGSEHLLLSLLKVKSEIIDEIKRYNRLTYKDVKKECLRFVGIGLVARDIQGYSGRAKEILKQASFEAHSLKALKVEPEHIFLALLDFQDATAIKIIEKIGFSAFDLKNDVIRELDIKDKAKQKESKQKIEASFLEKYGINMTAMAKKKKFDPLLHRDEELQRVVQILGRRTKNNPCLVGEPGVGKTAIVEGVAQLMVSSNAPDYLLNKTLVSISLASMISGSKFRGEFEDRLTQLVQEVRGKKNIILFIDEIHTLVGAGATQGAMDAANILKPFLSRDDIQLIGATTLVEYKKYIEKDAALERRLQPVMVKEPSLEVCIEMLKGIKSGYEDYHNLKIDDEAVVASVKLSHQYMVDRFLPDKAIDLMDEAASRGRLNGASQITKQDIYEVVSLWTNMPLGDLEESGSDALLNLEDKLNQQIIGQPIAVKTISEALKRSRVGLNDINKPLGVFFFVGTTGVGKTALAKALSMQLFAEEKALIRVDMSEYMEKHSVSKLIGSPPGYVAYEEGGQLTEKVRNRPFSVLLFDELEKAHPDVLNILLQLLDEGTITDSKGRVVSFKQTIIIFTSNVGSEKIQKKGIGFQSDQLASDDYLLFEESLKKELKVNFKTELLNRMDEIVVFQPLEEESVYKIIDLLLVDLSKRVEALGFTIDFSKGVYKKIFEIGYSKTYGVRSIKRSITRLIENPLSSYLLKTSSKIGHISFKLNGHREIDIRLKC